MRSVNSEAPRGVAPDFGVRRVDLASFTENGGGQGALQRVDAPLVARHELVGLGGVGRDVAVRALAGVVADVELVGLQQRRRRAGRTSRSPSRSARWSGWWPPCSRRITAFLPNGIRSASRKRYAEWILSLVLGLLRRGRRRPDGRRRAASWSARPSSRRRRPIPRCRCLAPAASGCRRRRSADRPRAC